MTALAKAAPDPGPPERDRADAPSLGVLQGGREDQSILTEKEWEKQGCEFKRMEETSRWDIGDWIVAAERAFDGEDKKKRPDRYTRAAQLTDLGYGRLRNLACTARAFAKSRRRDNLSFAHHTAVARRKDADTWLDKAAEGGWSEKVLQLKISEANDKKEPKARPERLVLSLDPGTHKRWIEASKASGANDLKAWVVKTVNAALGEGDQS